MESEHKFVSRGEAIGFAQRTRKNLEYMRNARADKEDVHVVAHLVNSLLGVVIVPKEEYFEKEFLQVPLEELPGRPWPTWNITLDEPWKNGWKTKQLKDLIWHLRNAAAHGRFRFTGDPESRCLVEVIIIVEDQHPDSPTLNWRAEIGGEELYQFCIRFSQYIDDSIG